MKGRAGTAVQPRRGVGVGVGSGTLHGGVRQRGIQQECVTSTVLKFRSLGWQSQFWRQA